MTNVETQGLEQSPSLGRAGGLGPLSSNNHLGAFVHRPE